MVEILSIITRMLNTEHKPRTGLFDGKELNRMETIRDDELEREGYEEENPVDKVWVRDGRGQMIQLEVEDDVDDN